MPEARAKLETRTIPIDVEYAVLVGTRLRQLR